MSGARIGEIIETSTVGFWAESATLHDLPPLGALVSVAVPEVGILYGVVAFGQTAGIDEGRRAVRRGNDEVFDGAIYDRHPELTRILRTTFRVVTVGYADEATGVMVEDGRGGAAFREVVLHPHVVVADAAMVDAATAAHAQAHEWCFIANSVNFPVRHEPTIEVA